MVWRQKPSCTSKLKRNNLVLQSMLNLFGNIYTGNFLVAIGLLWIQSDSFVGSMHNDSNFLWIGNIVYDRYVVAGMQCLGWAPGLTPTSAPSLTLVITCWVVWERRPSSLVEREMSCVDKKKVSRWIHLAWFWCRNYSLNKLSLPIIIIISWDPCGHLKVVLSVIWSVDTLPWQLRVLEGHAQFNW